MLPAGPIPYGKVYFVHGLEIPRLGENVVQHASSVRVHGKILLVHAGNAVVRAGVSRVPGEEPVADVQEFFGDGTVRRVHAQDAIVHNQGFPRVVAEFADDADVSIVNDPDTPVRCRKANDRVFLFDGCDEGKNGCVA